MFKEDFDRFIQAISKLDPITAYKLALFIYALGNFGIYYSKILAYRMIAEVLSFGDEDIKEKLKEIDSNVKKYYDEFFNALKEAFQKIDQLAERGKNAKV
jgi:hypothetical protein